MRKMIPRSAGNRVRIIRAAHGICIGKSVSLKISGTLPSGHTGRHFRKLRRSMSVLKGEHMKNIEIGTEFQKFVFSPECGGFPSRLSVTESDGSQLTLWDVKVPFLSLKTADGTTLRPVLQGRSAARKIREGSAKILEFPRIPWIDPATGALHPDLYLSSLGISRNGNHLLRSLSLIQFAAGARPAGLQTGDPAGFRRIR